MEDGKRALLQRGNHSTQFDLSEKEKSDTRSEILSLFEHGVPILHPSLLGKAPPTTETGARKLIIEPHPRRKILI